ncbi:hypothetical protein [Caenimonas aquaedulcis]|nr:hypothetical protein [Caenimonas aquaedulcis]
MSCSHRLAALCASLFLAIPTHAEVVRFEVLQSSPRSRAEASATWGPT